MKKLLLVLSLLINGFVFSQDSLKHVFLGYDYSTIKFLKDNNYNDYCSPESRYYIENDILDSLVKDYDIPLSEVINLKKQFIKYKSVTGINYKKIKETKPLMSYSEYLDSKVNYNPLFNLSRNSNIYVVNIIPIKSNNKKFKTIEIIEMYSIDIENNTLIFGTNIYTEGFNGVWDGVSSWYASGSVDCPVCITY